MIAPPMANDDMLSLSMFWAGLLMVFAPLISAAVVLGVWWRQRARARGATPDAHAPTVSAQERGSTTRPT
jgi:hypothetical protein